jgi:hypothetical protein
VLLATIAWVDLRALETLDCHRISADALCTSVLGEPCRGPGAIIGENVVLGGGLLAFGLIMSWFVPVNRFSLNGIPDAADPDASSARRAATAIPTGSPASTRTTTCASTISATSGRCT